MFLQAFEDFYFIFIDMMQNHWEQKLTLFIEIYHQTNSVSSTACPVFKTIRSVFPYFYLKLIAEGKNGEVESNVVLGAAFQATEKKRKKKIITKPK